MHNFVYIIYDTETLEVHCMFFDEDECIKVFKDLYEGFMNIDWIAINMRYGLSKWLGRPIYD